MLINCKTCASSYHIPREILGENGCVLRCVGCGEAWTVTPEAIAIGGGSIVEGKRIGSDGRYGLNDPQRPATDSGNGARSESGVAMRWASARIAVNHKLKEVIAALAAITIVGSAMGAIAARAAIVEAAPGAARIFAAIGLPVNLRGLTLDNVRTSIFDLGDRKMLVVEGAVVNLRNSAAETPNLRLALRSADKRELYVWTAPAPKATLAANEQVGFRTRLAAPPDGVSDVVVRFASGADKVVSMKEGL